MKVVYPVITSLSALLILCFQNCSNQNFSPRPEMADSSLIDSSSELVSDELPNDLVEGIQLDNVRDVSEDVVGSRPVVMREDIESNDDDDDVDNDDVKIKDYVLGDDNNKKYESKNDDDKNDESESVSYHEDDKKDDYKKHDYDKHENDKHDEIKAQLDHDDKSHQVVKNDKEKKSCNDKKFSSSRTPSSDSYHRKGVCILDGRGKSQHVALVNDALVNKNATPLTVCMSRSMCESVISRIAKVKSFEHRGYCRYSKQVLRLSDSDIKSLVARIK